MKRPEFVSLITAAISFIPYLMLAWAASELLDNTGFWEALGWLLGLRLFFGIVEMIGGILSWRVYGKRVSTGFFVQALREGGFPPRYDVYADADEYFDQVIADETQSLDTKVACGAFMGSIKAYRGVGLLPGLRIGSAWEAALEIHSPKASYVAPEHPYDDD
jgi:hypothetical protein